MGVNDYQDPPDIKEDDPKNGLMCFLDDTRECGPDCMGYFQGEVENSPLSPQQQNCILIISVERLGRYVGAGVSMLKKTKQDQDRAKQANPPDPLGRTK